MTESLGPQFLPGIDWHPYREDTTTPRTTQILDASPNRKPTEATARVPLPGMEKVSQFYGDEQRSQQSAELEKLKKNTVRYPLPEGFSITHSTLGHQPDGSLKHILTLKQPVDPMVPNLEVGSLTWNGDTGRVSWFGIDTPHRGLASHMITRAHEIAESMGEVGPTHSEDLSDDSYRMAKTHASAFLPKDAIIHGRTIDEHEEKLATRRSYRSLKYS